MKYGSIEIYRGWVELHIDSPYDDETVEGLAAELATSLEGRCRREEVDYLQQALNLQFRRFEDHL